MGTAVALVLVAPAWGPRPPAGEDVMAHLVRADFGIPELVAKGRLDGWFPRFVLGHQEFLFNGPGLAWVMALVRGATFGVLSNTGALKVVSMGSCVALVPAAWFLARSFGLSRPAAGLGAVLATSVSNPFGLGLEGAFGTGLIPHQVGGVLFCLALGACLRLLDDPRGRWRALAASALAGLAVTHLISVLVLAVVLVLCLLTLAPAGRSVMGGPAPPGRDRAGRRRPGRLLARAPGRPPRSPGSSTTWGTPPFGERLADIARGDVLLPAGLGAVAVVAWAYLLWRSGQRAPAAHHGPGRRPLRLSGRGPRLAPLAGRQRVDARNWATGASATPGCWPYSGSAPSWPHSRPVWGRWAIWPPWPASPSLALTAAPGRNAAGQLAEPVPPMRAAAAALARLVPDGARFATQRDYPAEIGRTGVIHPETWLARVSGRNSLNGFNLESSSTPGAGFAPDRLDESGPHASARRLSRLGVTHVVTTGEELLADLTRSGRFRPVWRDPPWPSSRWSPEPGQPAPGALLTSSPPIRARLTDPRPEHLAIDMEAPSPSKATVALAWSPKWHAHLNGRPHTLTHSSDGLVTLQLPAGTHRLRLDYRPDPWDALGPAITVLTLAGGAWWLRRHSRPEEGGDTATREGG